MQKSYQSLLVRIDTQPGGLTLTFQETPKEFIYDGRRFPKENKFGTPFFNVVSSDEKPHLDLEKKILYVWGNSGHKDVMQFLDLGDPEKTKSVEAALRRTIKYFNSRWQKEWLNGILG